MELQLVAFSTYKMNKILRTFNNFHFMGKNGVYSSKSRASGHLIGRREASFDTPKK